MPRFVNKSTGEVLEFTGAAADWAGKNPEFEPEGGLLETSLAGAPALLPREAAEFDTGAAGGHLGPTRQLAGEADAFGEQMFGGLGQEALTGVEGVASGLSLGGSDILLDLLGAETAERAEVNPNARLAGQVVGSVAPALVGGLAATPAGLAMRAGRAVEGVVPGAIKGMAAGAAVEGAIFGAGQGVGNLALANEPVTASAVVNEIGLNALLGGGLGGVLGGATGGLVKGGRALTSKLKRTDQAVGGEVGATAQEARNVADDIIEGLPEPETPPPTALDFDSDVGRALAAKIHTNMADFNRVADELLARGKPAAPPPALEATPSSAPTARTAPPTTQITAPTLERVGDLKVFGEDLLERAVLLNDKSLVPEIRQLKAAARDLLGASAPDGVGVEAVILAGYAEQYVQALRPLARKLGVSAEELDNLQTGWVGPKQAQTETQKAIREQKHVEKVGRAAASAEEGVARFNRAMGDIRGDSASKLGIDQAAPTEPPVEALAARKNFRAAWGLTDNDIIDGAALKRFVEKPVNEQVQAVAAFQTYQKTLDDLAQPTGIPGPKPTPPEMEPVQRMTLRGPDGDDIPYLPGDYSDTEYYDLAQFHRNRKSYEIADKLRAGRALSEEQTEIVDTLDHVFKRPVTDLPEGLTLYRGVRQGADIPKPGDTFTDAAFPFFTRDLVDGKSFVDENSGFLIEMTTGPGAKGVWFNGHQTPVVIPRNAPLKVVSVDPVNRVVKATYNGPTRPNLALHLDELKSITGQALPESAAVSGKDLIATLGLAGGADVVVPALDGPFDDLLKLGLAYKAVRKGGTAKAAAEAAQLPRDLQKNPVPSVVREEPLPKGNTLLGRLARGKFPEFAHRTARAFGWRTGRQAGGPGFAGTAAGAAGSVAGDMVMRGLARAILGTERLAGVTGSALSRVARLTAAGAGASGGVGRHGSAPALAILNAVALGDSTPEPTIQKAFKKRSAEISAAFANPQATQEAVHASLQSVRDAHLGVGDKLEMWMYRALDYLYKTMPKDPGNIHVLGKSTWMPDDFQIAEWASRWFGVDAPVEAMERTMAGEVNPAAVEAVRVVHPELFAEAQTAVMENLDQWENSTFDQRVALGTLLGVPIDSALDPEFIQFTQQSWMEREAAQQQPAGQPPTAGPMEPTTHAQSLQM